MAITLADFNKIWASTSPLTPYSFSESNYKQGWNFIGSTPPARQMWDFLQKQNDEKMQYIVNDICVPTEIDETSASGDYYSYPVPTGKVFANMKTLGGKTVAFNQLGGSVVATLGDASISDLTYTDGGKYKVTKTYTSTGYYQIYDKKTVEGHKYYAAVKGVSGSPLVVWLYNDGNGIRIVSDSINTFTREIATANGDGLLYLRFAPGTYTDVTITCKFFDLTLMFGAGNEPSTVEEFEALFPAETYPYNAGTLLSAGIKEVIAKDSSNNVVATMPIPSAVQSLEGYGWSTSNTNYNYIDFTRKKFVKNISSFVFDKSKLSFHQDSDGFAKFIYPKPSDSYGYGSYPSPTGNIIAEKLIAGYGANYTITTGGFGTNYLIFLPTGTTLTNAQDLLDGTKVYYKLATPVETDISSILGAVGIACGNTLTFDYDDDYKLPVPVSMDLIDNTYGMMTAQDKAKLEVVYDYIQRVSGN